MEFPYSRVHDFSLLPNDNVMRLRDKKLPATPL